MANQGKRMVKENLIAQIGQGGGATYTAGDGISISAEDVISVDNTVALKSELATVATTGAYSDLTGTPDLSHMVEDNDTTFPFVGNIKNNGGAFLYKKTNNDFYQASVTVESTDDPVLVNLEALSGDYTKLTNKPTIPDAVSGVNDGTNWTSITIGSTTKAIPQGGGSSYTAGSGISITGSTISVDNSVEQAEYYEFLTNPNDADFLSTVPVLSSTAYTPATDSKFPSNPVITTNPDDAKTRTIYIRGYFVVRDTANDQYVIISTSSTNNITTTHSDLARYMKTFKLERTGNSGYSFPRARYAGTFTNTNGAETSTFIRPTRNQYMEYGVNATNTDTEGTVIRISNPVANTNYAQQIQSPTTDGTYNLQVAVSSNTPTFSWAPYENTSVRKIEYKYGPVDASGLEAWLKGMPIIIAESTASNLTAFVNDLTNKGYTNIITDVAVGESVKVNGFFATPYTSGSTMLGLHYFCTDLGSSASQSVYGRSCNIEYELQRSDNRQLMMWRTRTRVLNTSLIDGTTKDPYSNDIEIVACSGNPQSMFQIDHRTGNGYEYGVAFEGCYLCAKHPVIGGGPQGGTQTGTTPGTYTLQCVVDANGQPTFSWVAVTP